MLAIEDIYNKAIEFYIYLW